MIIACKIHFATCYNYRVPNRCVLVFTNHVAKHANVLGEKNSAR